MPEPDLAVEMRGVVPAWIAQSLHDLCQPLTALECGLSIALMTTSDGAPPQPEEMEQAIRDGVQQCERMMNQVRQMQAGLQEAENRAAGSKR